MEGDREECLAAGMDDYVGKPVRAGELEMALARCLPGSGSGGGPSEGGATPVEPEAEEAPLAASEAGGDHKTP